MIIFVIQVFFSSVFVLYVVYEVSVYTVNRIKNRMSSYEKKLAEVETLEMLANEELKQAERLLC